MKTKDLIEKLEGIHTLESVVSTLGISRGTAINYITKLRKNGYVKTKRSSHGRRIYNISRLNKLGGKSYYEILNKISPIKLSESEVYKIYGREPTLEETLIYAIKTKKLRVILASLALFKHINNWVLLSELSKKNHVERQVGALYDLTRRIIKTRKMSEKFRKSSLPLEKYDFVFVIDGLKSKDFIDIEKVWKVYIPFNFSDFEEYQLRSVKR